MSPSWRSAARQRAARRRWRGTLADSAIQGRRRARAQAQPRERLADALGCRSTIGHQRDPLLGQLLIPGHQRRPRARAGTDSSDQRVSLREGLGVRAPGRRPRRPQRRHELVQVRPSQRRGALDELEPVGQEDAHQGALAYIQEPIDGGTVDAHSLGFPGDEPDRQLVHPIVGLRRRRRREPRRRQSGSLPVRCWSGTSAQYSRSTELPAGSSSRLHWGPRRRSPRRPARLARRGSHENRAA